MTEEYQQNKKKDKPGNYINEGEMMLFQNQNQGACYNCGKVGH